MIISFVQRSWDEYTELLAKSVKNAEKENKATVFDCSGEVG